jgi:hypothetical protein
MVTERPRRPARPPAGGGGACRGRRGVPAPDSQRPVQVFKRPGRGRFLWWASGRCGRGGRRPRPGPARRSGRAAAPAATAASTVGWEGASWQHGESRRAAFPGAVSGRPAPACPDNDTIPAAHPLGGKSLHLLFRVRQLALWPAARSPSRAGCGRSPSHLQLRPRRGGDRHARRGPLPERQGWWLRLNGMGWKCPGLPADHNAEGHLDASPRRPGPSASRASRPVKGREQPLPEAGGGGALTPRAATGGSI